MSKKTIDPAARLEELMLRRAMTPPELGESIGVTSQAVRNWLAGVKPNMKNAVKISKYFGDTNLLRSWGYGPTADAVEAGEL